MSKKTKNEKLFASAHELFQKIETWADAYEKVFYGYGKPGRCVGWHIDNIEEDHAEVIFEISRCRCCASDNEYEIVTPAMLEGDMMDDLEERAVEIKAQQVEDKRAEELARIEKLKSDELSQLARLQAKYQNEEK